MHFLHKMRRLCGWNMNPSGIEILNIPGLLPSISFSTHFLLPKYPTLYTESTPLNETGTSNLLPLDGNRKIIGNVLVKTTEFEPRHRQDYSLPRHVQNGCAVQPALSSSPWQLSPLIRTFVTVCDHIMTRYRMNGTHLHFT
jgi:hypothetical protein